MAFAEHLKNEGCKLKNANIFSQGNTHETLEDRIMEEEEEDARSETNDENP